MSELEWQESWSVGNPVLDDDHKKLLAIIQMISDYRPESADLTQLFAELEDYTKYHFAREEGLMDGADIPDLAAHLKSHRSFEEWLHSVRYAFTVSQESRSLLLDSVDEYLRKWLINHILKTDMDYKGLI
ncbi:MAG: hemerythrin family protein [Rhodospirillaceae bacterium]|nr:hemerythrin family protein [Rhodospirillaceae bacterium]